MKKNKTKDIKSDKNLKIRTAFVQKRIEWIALDIQM